MGTKGNSQPGIGPLAIVIIVITYSLVIFIPAITNFMSSESVFEYREYWNATFDSGLSNFRAAVALNIFLLIFVLSVLAFTLVAQNKRRLMTLALYLPSVGIVVFWSFFLFNVSRYWLNDTWYQQQIETEEFDEKGVYLGRIEAYANRPACEDDQSPVRVLLQHGGKVTVCIPNDEIGSGEIVALNRLVGRFSGNVRYEFDMSVYADDSEMMWDQIAGHQ